MGGQKVLPQYCQSSKLLAVLRVLAADGLPPCCASTSGVCGTSYSALLRALAPHEALLLLGTRPALCKDLPHVQYKGILAGLPRGEALLQVARGRAAAQQLDALRGGSGWAAADMFQKTTGEDRNAMRHGLEA